MTRKGTVHHINSKQEDSDEVYKEYQIRYTYRPKTNDFEWSFTETRVSTFKGQGQSLAQCKKAAHQYVDALTKAREKVKK